ncbi:hypothetical protein CMV_021597 [Castanea mollissima]|uniref:Uncharacterized protein n=1 Tax=Castanea mollissima TaxID=60419 RepID=A0A8J4QJK6_9ROSI|nr:hypothetical protein CMV_021597 [Castanea mollissima]
MVSAWKHWLNRLAVGPMQLKNIKGKTPALEICALSKIKSGAIKVVPGSKKFLSEQVELVNGEKLDIDSDGGKWLLAIVYRHNVTSWLQKEGEFFSRNSFPKAPFPNGSIKRSCWQHRLSAGLWL